MKAVKRSPYPIILLFTLLGMLSALPSAYSGNLTPPASPEAGGTMKPLDQVEPRIPIPASATAAEPFVIDQSGSYYLTGDRVASATGIDIQVSNVTIDLMGFTLTGPGSGTNYGIYINADHSNVEIRNGSVQHFGRYGIKAEGASCLGIRVIGVRAMSNGYSGITLLGKGNRVENCTAWNNGMDGIYVGKGSTVTGSNFFENARAGIYAQDGCTVTANCAESNGETGFQLCEGCTVIGNNALNNGKVGISALEGSVVTANTARSNQAHGIVAHANCLVDRNSATDNNLSEGAFVNLCIVSPCTEGLNHAP